LNCWIRLAELILVIWIRIFIFALTVTSDPRLPAGLASETCRDDATYTRNLTIEIKHGVWAVPLDESSDMFLKAVTK
jgi:hypothetical protein